jgi:hypothetical protein
MKIKGNALNQNLNLRKSSDSIAEEREKRIPQIIPKPKKNKTLVGTLSSKSLIVFIALIINYLY